MIINPDISKDELSDVQLISEYNNPVKYTIRSLYGVMAKRASANDDIKNILFGIILSEDARKESEMGIIMHAWLPAIFILQLSTDDLKQELKKVLRQWSDEEKKMFLGYIKSDQEYYCLLYDI